MFGVNDLQGWYGAFDIRTGRAFLFMPRLPASYAVWMGHILRLEEAKVKGRSWLPDTRRLLHSCCPAW